MPDPRSPSPELRPELQTVMFDAVGTLIYPDPPAAVVYSEHGRKFGIELDGEEVAARFRAAFRRSIEADILPDPQASVSLRRRPTDEANERQRWRAIVAEVFCERDDTETLFESLWQHFSRPQSWSLFADAEPAWRALETRGYQLGIASNFDARLDAIRAGIPLLRDCRRFFQSAALGSAKPSPEFFRSIEARLSRQPNQLLLVGDDRLNDIAGARSAGWAAIRVARDAPPADDEVGSLEQLARWLPPREC